MVIAITSAWDNYNTLMLWAHESCHLTERHLDIPLNVSVPENLGFCSRNKFHHLHQHISAMGLEFIALQYCPNVAHAAREALENQALEYYSQYHPVVADQYVGIKAITLEEGKVTSIGRSPPKPFYFPVHYMHPLEKNEKAVEIDLYSYRSEWVEKAFRTHAPVLSGRARLFQDPREEIWAVEMIHPGVYTEAEEERKHGEEWDGIKRRLDHPPQNDEIPGTAVTKLVIRVTDLIEHAFRVTNVYQGMSVYMYDMSMEQEKKPVFLAGVDVIGQDKIALHNETDLDDIHKHKLPVGNLFFEQTIDVADRQWLVVVTPHDKDLYSGEFAFIILGGSIIFVACIILACWFRVHLEKTSRMNHLQAEAEKERAKHAENIALRERNLNDFLSHELRNPLSAALVALNFVTETTNEQVHAEHTRRALNDDICILENSLQYMNDLLRNMLDIHRTNSKYIKIKNEPINLLKDVLEPCKTIVTVRGSQASMVDIQVASDPEDLIVNVDRLRLEQIVLNLALNATKFVKSGYIRIRCGIIHSAVTGHESVAVIVEDSGPGIPEEKRSNLFQKYSTSLNLVDQGTGIGLYICKHLTQLMEASIRLDDQYESGARFVVDLQRPPMLEQHHRPLLDDTSRNDSQKDTPATSISSTITALNEDQVPLSQSRRPSFSLLKRRSLSNQEDGESSHSSRPSSHRALDEAEETKNNQSLDAQEPKCGNLSGQTHTLEILESTSLPSSLRVLFVDDDITVRKLFVRSLRRLCKEWDISEAPNGETAIRMIVENEQRYHLIFMDQYMASTEKQLLGTETIENLRLHGVDSLICGLSANDCERPFLKSGADAFLLKPLPFQQSALKKELIRILSCHGSLTTTGSENRHDSRSFILIDGSHFQKSSAAVEEMT